MKLVITSILFLSNFIHNSYYQEYIYAWLFLLLTTTSFFIHSEIFADSLDIVSFIIFIDKLVILNIFFYGFYLYWKSGVSIIPIVSVISVTLLYTKIYNTTKEESEKIHMIMHLIGCLGHHVIIKEYGDFLEIQNIKEKMKSYFINKIQMDAEFWGKVLPALSEAYNVIEGY